MASCWGRMGGPWGLHGLVLSWGAVSVTVEVTEPLSVGLATAQRRTLFLRPPCLGPCTLHSPAMPHPGWWLRGLGEWPPLVSPP